MPKRETPVNKSRAVIRLNILIRMVIFTLSQNFTSGFVYTLTMLIERNEGLKLLKRISRHEPHDPIAWINKNIPPILTIQAFEMFTQFDML